jgi:hypothetical protein
MDNILILRISIDILVGYPLRIGILDRYPWFQISSPGVPDLSDLYRLIQPYPTYQTYPLHPSSQMMPVKVHPHILKLTSSHVERLLTCEPIADSAQGCCIPSCTFTPHNPLHTCTCFDSDSLFPFPCLFMPQGEGPSAPTSLIYMHPLSAPQVWRALLFTTNALIRGEY